MYIQVIHNKRLPRIFSHNAFLFHKMVKYFNCWNLYAYYLPLIRAILIWSNSIPFLPPNEEESSSVLLNRPFIRQRANIFGPFSPRSFHCLLDNMSFTVVSSASTTDVCTIDNKENGSVLQKKHNTSENKHIKMKWSELSEYFCGRIQC